MHLEGKIPYRLDLFQIKSKSGFKSRPAGTGFRWLELLSPVCATPIAASPRDSRMTGTSR
jgi:hypothetical protein